jgi:hypothetical protein
VALIHEKHGNRLYRVAVDGGSFVLKWFGEANGAVEVQAYALLERLGVPTLPVHGRGDRALLLEDLAVSETWRPAEEADVERAATGAAVGEWYRTFHAAGQGVVAAPARRPAFLAREIDALDAESIVAAGERLGLGASPGWALAAEHVEAITDAMRALPETLNYNDFYWRNLALSRDAPLRAVVYDYHLLGIGLRTSDCRNATGSLGDRAAAAFWEVYGAVDEREGVLDEPASILYSLVVAPRRTSLPAWAWGCVRAVESGQLERSLRRALEVL